MKRKSVRLCLFALATICLIGCAAPRNTITQIGAIDALLAGAYDGEMPTAFLAGKGSIGLGTFDRLDGEMVVVDSHVYQVRADGKVYSPPGDVSTPFAAVVNFHPTLSKKIKAGTTFAEFHDRLDAFLPNTNVICIFRMTGTFRQMKTRSVAAQTKPYVPLVEATKHQSVFDLGSCRGTMVGFRMPGFVKGVNVTGCHAHFLTENRQAGGHVLEFTLEEGTLEMAFCSRLDLQLPIDADALKDIDFSRDRTGDLDKSEK